MVIQKNLGKEQFCKKNKKFSQNLLTEEQFCGIINTEKKER
jgi:hypothetical protein